MLRILAALVMLAGLSGTSLGAERSGGFVVEYDDPEFDLVMDFLVDECVLLGTVGGKTWFQSDDMFIVCEIGKLGVEVQTTDDPPETPVVVRVVGHSGSDPQ